MRGKFHVRLNNGERPIANKYREGKMQRTLKRELKVLEIVKREAIGTSTCTRPDQPGHARRPWQGERLRSSPCGGPARLAGSTPVGTGQHPWGKGEMGRGEATGRHPRGVVRR